MFVFRAAVGGAGTMGGQIAQTIAAAGIPVVLKYIAEELVRAGLEEAANVTRGQVGKLVEKGRATAEQAEQQIAEARAAADRNAQERIAAERAAAQKAADERIATEKAAIEKQTQAQIASARAAAEQEAANRVRAAAEEVRRNEETLVRQADSLANSGNTDQANAMYIRLANSAHASRDAIAAAATAETQRGTRTSKADTRFSGFCRRL